MSQQLFASHCGEMNSFHGLLDGLGEAQISYIKKKSQLPGVWMVRPHSSPEMKDLQEM